MRELAFELDRLIAIFIAISGLYLIRDNIGYLMGDAPPREFFEKVRAIAISEEGVLGVHEIVSEYGRPNIIIMGLHIEVKGGTPIEEADWIAGNVKKRIMQEGGCSYCIIHVDSVNPG
jgi:divalent metal cation (Fe/Co/Zn/Cd) transporter